MSERRTTRRQFTKAVAAAAAVAVATAATGSAAQPEPPSVADAAESLTAVVRQRYGKHLNEELLKRVRQRIESQLRTAEALRRTSITNADEPDFVFVAELP